jgi:hypothetical protein
MVQEKSPSTTHSAATIQLASEPGSGISNGHSAITEEGAFV